MANTDGFIDEVTEELRRDRMAMLLRRWGWVALLLVVLLVGAAAWNEWRQARAAATAEAFGDAVTAALVAQDADVRAGALAAMEPATPEQATILALARAGVAAETDPEAAARALVEFAATAGAPAPYGDLALMKAMTMGGTGDPARDGAILADLATPGAPFRPLAVEMQAQRAIEAGDMATAATLLRLLTEDAEASEALRGRARQTMTVLGIEAEAA